jgi:hypothetical protein
MDFRTDRWPLGPPRHDAIAKRRGAFGKKRFIAPGMMIVSASGEGDDLCQQRRSSVHTVSLLEDGAL